MNELPLIVAHRGASAHAPENTLAAFEMALDAGADGIEFDVRLAKDKVPVVIHDATLERTGSRKGSVSSFTSEELGKIDVVSWFNSQHPGRSNPAFPHQTIPTLTQVLDLLESFRGLIYIELKPNENDFRDLVWAVCDIIGPSVLLSQIIVKSFKLAVIPEVGYHLPEVQTAALFEPTIMNYLRKRKHIVAVAREFGAAQVSLHHSLVTSKLVSLASEAQMPVTIWTTDKPKWLKRCRKLGIHALITNDPAKFIMLR